ncbi:MAG TPA: glycosyltransferase family 4 protein [Pyrinomonadaceae bacterium]|jgi:glycosyltransferase involved in cell wall biosynthesis
MEQNRKPIILVLCDYYLPGYKSGGGMRAIVNMVDRLKDKFDFRIVTRDHDKTRDRRQYETVDINEWNELRGAKVFYLSKDNVKISKLRELVLQVKPDSIYVNSYFATLTIFVLQLRKLRLIPRINIVLAPCGELSDGALQLKAGKKRLFIGFSKLSRLYKDIIWKASNELEKAEIERIKGKTGEIYIAPDLPPRTIFDNYMQDLKLKKKIGEARMIFLSRFMRKKNFKWLLEFISEIEGNLTIDVYGPLEDEAYWAECQTIIEKLPSNIKVESKGGISYEKVAETLFKYHFFILPTLGENFGYVFLEALAAGCPLIISDRTPWLNLENDKIGWDLSLENKEEWIKTINHCINMDASTYSNYSITARQFADDWLQNPEIEESTLKILSDSSTFALSLASKY